MKKFLLSLAAIALSVSANAQVAAFKTDASVTPEKESALLALPDQEQEVMKAPVKATLAKNQKYVGLEIDETIPKSGYGIPSCAGQTLKAGVYLSQSVLSQYVGCRIIGARFAVCQAVGTSAVDVAPVSASGVSAAILTDTVKTTAVGWNEVKFATPHTITSSDAFIVSYSYYQTSSNSTCYPMAVSGKSDDNGFYVYGNLNSTYGERWYTMSGGGYGNLMIQLLIESDKDFTQYDLALSSVSISKFVSKATEKTKLTFRVKNNGTTDVNAATFGASIDGTEYLTIELKSSDGITINGSEKNLIATVDMPSGLTIGSHEYSVYLKSVMGAAPAGNLDNDKATCTFNVVSETKKHQKQLVEHFTSQYCKYCPLGYDILNQMIKDRNDIAWVSIHGIGDFQDVYTTDNASYIINFSVSGYPSANFNRYYVDGESSLACSLGYNSQYTKKAANMFSSVLDESCENMPSFADVDIATTYDAETKKLSIKVSGETTSDFNTVFGDGAALTVYLTEDSLYARQYNQNTWVSSYLHNNVLRQIVTSPLGDAITLNGTKYENNYEITLNSAWKAENMHVVAFIGRPIKYSAATGKFTTATTDAGVTNCNSVKIAEATGISNAVTDAADNTVVARYTLGGQQISAPVKGINIVKLASGKTMKVMVK